MKKILTIVMLSLLVGCQKEELIIEPTEPACHCVVEQIIDKHQSWKVWASCLKDPLVFDFNNGAPEVGDCLDR